MIASELDGKKHGYYKIISFSFKRIREILLSYLIVVFFTLLFMALFVNANNYDELVDRTIEALFFYFNITPPSDTVMFNRMVCIYNYVFNKTILV
jgi:peptidoglycan/LPS O-acetylase OafA/YrhL